MTSCGLCYKPSGFLRSPHHCCKITPLFILIRQINDDDDDDDDDNEIKAKAISVYFSKQRLGARVLTPAFCWQVAKNVLWCSPMMIHLE